MRVRTCSAIVRNLIVIVVGMLASLPAQHYLQGLALPNDPAPNGMWYGSGCGGASSSSGTQQATVSISPQMFPGMQATVLIENLPPGQPALLMIGTQPDSWVGMPLPLSLAAVGMNGCELLVPPNEMIPFGTGTGSATASFGVPVHPVLAGAPLYYQALFAQPGLNAAGLGVSRGFATRVAPLPAPTAMVSSLSQHGITFQFAQPVEAGQFVNGDWFVVGPATIAAMTPACAVVNGRVINGAMVSPDPSTQDHGYDSTLFDVQHYSHGRNAAWNLSAANPLQLQPSDSLVKVISNQDPTLLPALKTCAVLTVLDHVPPRGSFRPPYAGADRTVRYDELMIDWSVLQSLPAAAGMPDPVVEAAQFARPWLDHAPGWATRYMHPTDNMPDYGRDLASLFNEAALLCNADLPQSDKQLLAIALLQVGIDFWGNVQGGAYWEGVGGHGSGRKFPILFAGALLGDQDMLAVGTTHQSRRQLDGSFTAFFGEDCQTFYVQQTGQNEINWGHGGYVASQIGMPEFGFSHVSYPSNDDVAWASNSYRLCCTANAWIGAVLGAYVMGLEDEWNHPALFDYTDRYVSFQSSGWTMAWSPWVRAMWHMHRSAY